MDIEMIMPEEVNNTNLRNRILHSEEEVFNQRRFGQSNVVPQDYMKIAVQKYLQLFEQELRQFERFVPSKLVVRKYQRLFEQELRRFGQSDVLPQDDMKIKIDAQEYRQLFEQELQRFVQSDVLPQDDMKIKIDAQECRQLFEQELQSYVLPQGRRIIREVVLGFTEFLTYILHSVFLLPDHYHRALYILMFCVVRHQAQALITQSASKLGTQSLLSMGEAFTEFFPQMTQMMTIMLCYLLMLWLVCPLNPVLQISIVLVLIAAPCYYIPQVLGMASGIDVACGFFKVPLIWFTASVALALALIFVFMSLLLIYLIRRFIHPGNLRENQSNFIPPGDPRVEKLIKVSLDALSGENMA